MVKLIVLLIFLPMLVLSQDLLINTPNRTLTSLNGSWNYIVDPYENGYYSFHKEVYDETNPKSPSAYYNNYHTSNKSELVEYDFDKSPGIQVPGDWNTQKENLYYYEGTVWYKKSFDYDLKENKRLFVYFGAVNYRSDVYLNGTKLGIHEGGFTPFNFEITSLVKPTGNYLVVKVNNTRKLEAVPALNTDWWNYGGITRDVLLIEEPAVFIRDYSVQLKKGDRNTIKGFVQLSDKLKGEKVTIDIPELNIIKELITTAEGRAQFEYKIVTVKGKKLYYWSPESPKLYEIIFKTGSQVLKDEIGFRTIETKGPDILLNGRPVFLRGISIHEEYKGRRAYSESDAISLLTWAKELGCNFVRLAHYPHNENMLRMADKMGLLVWEEIPVYWSIDFTNEKTFDNAKNQLTDVITRDKNRACTIIWSMANETPLSDARNLFLINLVNLARELDATRLISAALLSHSENGTGIIDDKIGEFVDIVAFNQYTGWYGGDLETAPDARWSTPYNKPVVVSEFGGGALQGLHGNRDERWTEEYQEYLYQQNLKMIEKNPNIRGISPWILTDFRSPRRVLSGIQDGFNRKGLISDKGKKKKAFFILKEFYKKIKLQYE